MQKILNAIKCGNCLSILNSPILLPCGHSICKSHVTNIPNSEIKCFTCGIDFKIPINGFYQVKALNDIISSQLHELNLGQVYQKAKEHCNELQEFIGKTKLRLQDPNSFRNGIVEDLNNVILLKSEQLKEKIDQETEILFAEVNEIGYCHEESEFKNNSTKNVFESIKKTELELNSWNKRLDTFKFDEKMWQEILDNSMKKKLEISEQLDELSCSTFYKYQELKEHSNFFKSIEIDFIYE